MDYIVEINLLSIAAFVIISMALQKIIKTTEILLNKISCVQNKKNNKRIGFK